MKRREHLLIILAEECAEVQQAITKALRFGLYEGRDTKETNVKRLDEELNHLAAMVEMLEVDGVDVSPDFGVRKEKKDNVEKYLGYSQNCGTLN